MASWQARVAQAPSAETVAMSSFAEIWARRFGSIGASPTLLEMTSTARIALDAHSVEAPHVDGRVDPLETDHGREHLELVQ
jgi:hypothetical protein|tara:strand:+ start:22346 stop:22588 length:243 start_codon:yes stop_codon:yes gene_type:complete